MYCSPNFPTMQRVINYTEGGGGGGGGDNTEMHTGL